MADILGEPLMMLGFSVSLVVLWIESFQFFRDTRGEAGVHQVLGVIANHGRTINLHATPLPTPETEHFSVEVIWKTLGPCRVLLAKVLVENLLESFTISNFLIASNLVN